MLQRAEANGVEGLRFIDGDEASRLEPALQCAAAIESAESGIVDVPEYVMALIGEIERIVIETQESGHRIIVARRLCSRSMCWSRRTR